MSSIDIRKHDAIPDRITFSNIEGGSAKVHSVETFLPSLVKLRTVNDEYVVVISEDIPNLIKALEAATLLWNLETK